MTDRADRMDIAIKEWGRIVRGWIEDGKTPPIDRIYKQWDALLEKHKLEGCHKL